MEKKFSEFQVEFICQKRAEILDKENDLDFIQRNIVMPLFRFKKYITGTELSFLQKTIDERYFVVMHVKVWELDEIYNLYFLYVNPIFIFCAFYNGLEIIIIDIFSVFLIDFLIDQTKSQASGERFIHSVFKAEEKKMQAR